MRNEPAIACERLLRLHSKPLAADPQVFLRDRNRQSPIGNRKSVRGVEMDWRVFLTTFGVIFLAEMGDKTQLAAMTMAAESKKPWAVFFAAALSLAAVSAVGVGVGSLLGNYLPLIWIKRGAAVAFI